MADYTVVWSDKTYSSLRKIHDFTAKTSREGAKNIVRAIVQYSQSLGTLPRRNPIEPNLADAPYEYRFLIKWNFKIIYTVLEEDRMVLVVVVFDTRQDPKKLKL